MVKLSNLLFFTLLFISISSLSANKLDSLMLLAGQSGDKEKPALYLQIAKQYQSNNDSLSIDYSIKAVKGAKKFNLQLIEAQALENMGVSYCNQARYQIALDTLMSALKIYEKLNFPQEATLCLNNIGNTYDYLSNFENAEKYYNKALGLAKRYKNRYNESLVVFNLGNIYLKQYKYSKALENFLVSLAIEEQMGNEIGVAYCLNDLAMIYEVLHLYDRQENSIKRALEIFKKKGYVFEESVLLNNLGDFYLSQKFYDKAIENYFLSAKTKESINHVGGLILTYSKIGDVYFTQNITDSAELYYQKAYNIAQKTGFNVNKSSVLLGMGKIHFNKKQYNKAKNAFEECYEIATKGEMNELRRDVLLELYKTDSALGDVAGSNRALRKAYELAQALNDKEAKQRIGEMMFTFETEKKDREIALQKSINNKQRMLLWAAIVFIVFVTFLSVIIFIQFRNIKKNNQLLALQKAEIDAKNIKLRELDELKSRFFTNISHEFRTPLTLVTGNLELLHDKAESSGEDVETYNIMLRHSRRLLDLINQLLEISKLEKNKMKLFIHYGNVGEFVFRIVSSFESWAVEKNLIFDYTQIDKSGNCWFDADKLEKVITNLISNAIKYTTEGSITIKSKITGNQFMVEITDTGPGLTTNELGHIWELFYQAGAQADKLYEGSGIGLALVKELVKLMQGEISVSSQPGKGTSFSITLPVDYEQSENIVIVENAESKTYEPIVANENTHKKGLHSGPVQNTNSEMVLVIEDNDDLRHFICSNLLANYRIIEAVDGIDGLEKAFVSVPDLIITDVMMPRMNGLEMTKKIKTDERTSHIPVIMLTARVAHEHVIEGLEMGTDEYLPKPFSIKELLLRINNILRTKQQIREKLKVSNDLYAPDVHISSVDERFLKKALDIIEAHIEDCDYEVIQFCADLGMSRTNLHRKLKAITGQSTTEFIRNTRLKRAALLLKNNAGTVSEIAYQTGFTNLSYFTKSFKDLYGVTPSEYS